MRTPLKELYVKLRNVYVGRSNFKGSQSSKFRDCFGLSKFDFRYFLTRSKAADLLKFTLLRINKVVWTNELVARKKIGEHYKNRCITCDLEGKEDVEHFILECCYYNCIRSGYSLTLGKFKALTRSNIALIGLILGNKLNVDGEERLTMEMMQMLSSMLKVRSIRVPNEVSLVPRS